VKYEHSPALRPRERKLAVELDKLKSNFKFKKNHNTIDRLYENKI